MIGNVTVVQESGLSFLVSEALRGFPLPSKSVSAKSSKKSNNKNKYWILSLVFPVPPPTPQLPTPQLLLPLYLNCSRHGTGRIELLFSSGLSAQPISGFLLLQALASRNALPFFLTLADLWRSINPDDTDTFVHVVENCFKRLYGATTKSRSWEFLIKEI